jgi:hypothetical protein
MLDKNAMRNALTALLEWNAGVWERLYQSSGGMLALKLGSILLILHFFATSVVLLLACVGGSYIFEVLMPESPEIQAIAWMEPLLGGCVQYLTYFNMAIPVVLLISLISGMYTLYTSGKLLKMVRS